MNKTRITKTSKAKLDIDMEKKFIDEAMNILKKAVRKTRNPERTMRLAIGRTSQQHTNHTIQLPVDFYGVGLLQETLYNYDQFCDEDNFEIIDENDFEFEQTRTGDIISYNTCDLKYDGSLNFRSNKKQKMVLYSQIITFDDQYDMSRYRSSDIEPVEINCELGRQFHGKCIGETFDYHGKRYMITDNSRIKLAEKNKVPARVRKQKPIYVKK